MRKLLVGDCIGQMRTLPDASVHTCVTSPPDLIEPCILAGCPEGGTVLDPFFGAGTTGLVAQKHGRSWIGCELNPAYVDIALRRLGAFDLNAWMAAA